MNKENDKLNKFKAEAKLKSKKSDFFNSYLQKTNNIDDKIALIKFKYKDDNQQLLHTFEKLHFLDFCSNFPFQLQNMHL